VIGQGQGEQPDERTHRAPTRTQAPAPQFTALSYLHRMRTELSAFNESADQPGASRDQPRSQPVRAPRQSAFVLLRRQQSAQRQSLVLGTGYNTSSSSKAAMLSSDHRRANLAERAERTAQRIWDPTAALPGTAGLLPGADPAPAPQPEASALKAGWLLRSHNDHSATHRQWKRQWVRQSRYSVCLVGI